MAKKPVAERYYAMVEVRPGSSCHWWTGYKNAFGYGRFGPSRGHSVQAHRFGYELARGPIPPGLHIDHLCRNRACVNPDHLEPVTPTENILRGVGATARNARKRKCPRGHEYDANRVRRDGSRFCSVCNRLKQNARRVEIRQMMRERPLLLDAVEAAERLRKLDAVKDDWDSDLNAARDAFDAAVARLNGG